MERKRGSAGFSLVEVLTAIAVLGIVAAALGGCLVMAHRINARSEQIMQARWDVSRAVETLMAEGIDQSKFVTGTSGSYNGLSGDYNVTVSAEPAADPTVLTRSDLNAYNVTVTSTVAEDVTVTTCIRAAAVSGGTGGGE